jgi:hypothetical protein
MEAVFFVRSVSRLYKESALSLQLVLRRQLVNPTRELTAEGSTSWSQSAERSVSSRWELTAEGSTSLSQQSEVDVRWSPACEDVNPETEERPPLEAVTKHRDLEH